MTTNTQVLFTGAIYPLNTDHEKGEYQFNLATKIAIAVSLVALTILLAGAITLLIPATTTVAASAIAALGGLKFACGLLTTGILSSIVALTTNYARNNFVHERYLKPGSYKIFHFEEGKSDRGEDVDKNKNVKALFDFRSPPFSWCKGRLEHDY